MTSARRGRDLGRSSALLMAITLGMVVNSASALNSTPVSSTSDYIAALAMRSYVRSQTHACGQASPADAWLLNSVEYFWESDNLAAFRTADAMLAAMTGAKRKSAEDEIQANASRISTSPRSDSPTSLGGAAGCQQFFSRLTDYQNRHDLLGQGIYKRLEDAYIAQRGGREDLRRDMQKQDLVVGCMKEAMRVGNHNFDAVHEFCSCTMDAVSSSATPAELDEYLGSLASSGQSHSAAVANVMGKPWFQRAVPAMKACAPVRKP